VVREKRESISGRHQPLGVNSAPTETKRKWSSETYLIQKKVLKTLSGPPEKGKTKPHVSLRNLMKKAKGETIVKDRERKKKKILRVEKV